MKVQIVFPETRQPNAPDRRLEIDWPAGTPLRLDERLPADLLSERPELRVISISIPADGDQDGLTLQPPIVRLTDFEEPRT